MCGKIVFEFGLDEFELIIFYCQIRLCWFVFKLIGLCLCITRYISILGGLGWINLGLLDSSFKAFDSFQVRVALGLYHSSLSI